MMRQGRGKTNKRDPNSSYNLKFNPERQAGDPTAFEIEAKRLKLLPAQYQTSVQLREWARKWCSSKYVPEKLLEAWGMERLAEGFKVGWGSM
jgi:hypothetical protein